MEQKRLNYFDMAKGIGIFLVVLGHIEFISTPLRGFIVSFHMPLFFIISGMLLSLSDDLNKDFKSVFFRKLSRLMIPYFCFSILYSVIEAGFYFFGGAGSLTDIFKNIYLSVCLHGVSVLWFLPALFFGELLFLFLQKKISYVKLCIFSLLIVFAAYFLNIGLSYLNIVLGSLPWYFFLQYFLIMLVRILFAYIFIIAGYLFSKFLFRFSLPDWLGVLSGILLLFVTFFISQINGVVDMHFLVFNNIFLYYLASLMGSFGLILICKSLERFSQALPLRFLQYYGKNSLVIMATHINFYVLYCSIVVSLHFVKYISRAKNYFLCFGILLLVFISEIFIIEIINRLFPFILGKKKNKRSS